jgi:hypothetical protein
MDDPDMGKWTYKYDVNGNLRRQIDERSNWINDEAICLYYDDLNRLILKSEDDTPYDGCLPYDNAPEDGPYHLASYVYDTATNGIGLPAEISWGPNPDENKESFSYDSFSRLTASLIRWRPLTLTITTGRSWLSILMDRSWR